MDDLEGAVVNGDFYADSPLEMALGLVLVKVGAITEPDEGDEIPTLSLLNAAADFLAGDYDRSTIHIPRRN